MNMYDYSVHLLKVVQNEFKTLREEVYNNSDNVSIKEDFDLKIQITFTNNPKMFFEISNPKQRETGAVYFNIKQKPTNIYKLEARNYTVKSEKDSIVRHFKSWLGVIKNYESIHVHPTDTAIQKYKEEFNSNFRFIEDEDDNETLNIETQSKLREFIRKTIEYVEKEESVEGDFNEVKLELKELNKQIPLLTKAQVKIKFYSALSKLYIKGIDMFNWLIKNGTQYGFTKILDGLIN